MDQVLQELERHGFQARIVSASRLPELEEAIVSRRDRGEFSQNFYRERLSYFRFNPPESLPGARSIIVAAFLQPKTRVLLHLDGKPIPVDIPPTYLYYPDSFAENILQGILKPVGYRLARTALPLKLLAVRSGLATYGRNNISYVPGMGSYHRLMAFYSDYPAADDSWLTARLMNSCAQCWACLRNCPTGAIAEDRFLLNAERCLTYLNEKPGDFPGFVHPSFHNALVGCFHCQDVCPENRPFRHRVEPGEEFSEEESRLLLRYEAAGNLPASIRRRLENMDLMDYIGFLPRNLRAVIAASSSGFCDREK
ncbi:MAG: 4Fe-4S double cluster binding domain-containing protein [Candidatus Aminicenantales bacterium]